ncbi:MAG: xanthine dehydrogenase family protein molybdopterin-binding subunit [Dermatophilaceae bacterium]
MSGRSVAERTSQALKSLIGRGSRHRERSIIGQSIPRTDGRAKVTGEAAYAADMRVTGVAHGFLAMSTIARGRIAAIDTRAAETAKGVIAVFTHLNMPRLTIPPPETLFIKGYLPLQEDQIHHFGQPVALVVAGTLAQAQDAASLVEVTYDRLPHDVDFFAGLDGSTMPPGGIGGPNDYRRGDVETGMAQADVRLEAEYTNPMHHHNPMEPSSTVAVWEGSRLTVYDSTQSIGFTQGALAAALSVPVDDVRVRSPFLGGGFGSKGPVWPHAILTAAVARQIRRPVKLTLSRAHMYTSSGHRAVSTQRIRLGARRDGQLTAVEHVTTQQTTRPTGAIFSNSRATRMSYAIPNLISQQRVVELDLPAQCFMRSPEVVAGHGLECALDELSDELGLDPIELRRRNEPPVNPMTGEPWGSRYLLECFERGSQLFGWSRRNPTPESMRDGAETLGWGMATSAHTSGARPGSAASVTLSINGTAQVRSGTQDLGTGTYTVMTQIAAQELGLTVPAVSFELGDTTLPPAGSSGESATVPSVGSVVVDVCRRARDELIAFAVTYPDGPLAGLAPEAVMAEHGFLISRDEPRRRWSVRDAMSARERPIEITGEPVATAEGYSVGASFVEVGIEPRLGSLRVRRVVGVYDTGTVLNHMTARSQAVGGIIFAIGYALMEHTVVDRNLGQMMNTNLSDYLIPVNADIPDMQIEFLDKPDPTSKALGARGFGETPMMGMTAAIANAVAHATGQRFRDLPITRDRIMRRA